VLANAKCEVSESEEAARTRLRASGFLAFAASSGVDIVVIFILVRALHLRIGLAKRA
jgi:hypothetical protein